MFAAAAPRLARAPRAHSAHTSRAALSAVPTMLHTKPAVAIPEGACLRAFTPSTMPTMPKIRPTYTYRKENTIERMPSTSEMMPSVLLPPALPGYMLLSMLGCICSIIEYLLKSPV